MSTRFVFLGPPGAGKGTQANLAGARIGVPAIATGRIFREAINENTAMGREIAQFVSSGMLVPDKLTNAIVAARLKGKDCKKGFILDGYPRNLQQAETLDSNLVKVKRYIESVLYFKVDVSVVIDRMSQRRICNQCGTTYNLVSQLPKRSGLCDKCPGSLIIRNDDVPDAIRKRLSIYEQVISPLLDYYEKKGILNVLNASLSVDEVAKQVALVCSRN